MVHARVHTHGDRRKKRDLKSFLDSIGLGDLPNNGDNDGNAQKTEVFYVTVRNTLVSHAGSHSTDASPTPARPTVGVGAPVRQTAAGEAISTAEPTPREKESASNGPSAETVHRANTDSTQTAKPVHTTDAIRMTETAAPERPTTTSIMTTSVTSALAMTTLAAAPTLSSISATEPRVVPMTTTAAPRETSLESSPAAASSTLSRSGGLSGGAKGGIAAGVIAGVALVIGLVVFWMWKKRRTQGRGTQDDEKAFNDHNLAPPGPPHSSELLNALASVEANPPQLNVRPMTELGFNFNSSGAHAAGTASANSGPSDAPASRSLTSTPADGVQSQLSFNTSNMSRDPFSDPVNPFSSRAETSSPPGTAYSVSQHTLPANGHVMAPNLAPSTAENIPTAGSSITSAALAGAAAGLTSKSNEGGSPFRPEALGSCPASETGSTETETVNAGGAMLAGGLGPMNVYRVQMDFTPSMEDELALQAGQLIRLLHEYDDGWALCIRMDRSQQGVAPRSCLSASPVKPRPRPSADSVQGRRGPPIMGPNGRPMSSASGRTPAGSMQPRFYPQSGQGAYPGRPGFPGSPTGSSRPISLAQQPVRPGQRSMSPAQRSMSPAQRSMSPAQQQPIPPGQKLIFPVELPDRPISSAQFPQVPPPLAMGPSSRPNPPRSMSPGPYELPGLPKPSMRVAQRARSNSTGATSIPSLTKKPSPLGSLPPTPAPSGKLPEIPMQQPSIKRKPAPSDQAE